MADNLSVVLNGLYIDSDIPFGLYMVDVAVNTVFSITAILGNTFIIVALWKLSPLQIHSVLKAFLFSLALADLGVGVIVQPLYITTVLTAMNKQLKSSRTIGAIFYVVNWILPFVSFATLTGIAIDRYLALHFRLRYRILVTKKRVVPLLILLWLLTIAGTSLMLWNHNYYNAFATAVVALFLLLTTTAYLKIYLTLKHHDGRFRAVTPVETSTRNLRLGNKVNFSVNRYEQTVYNMLYVYAAFVLCYLPLFCVLIVIHARGVNRTLKIFRFVGATLIFVNSSLNPLLYCWKICALRQVGWSALKKVFCCSG